MKSDFEGAAAEREQLAIEVAAEKERQAEEDHKLMEEYARRLEAEERRRVEERRGSSRVAMVRGTRARLCAACSS